MSFALRPLERTFHPYFFRATLNRVQRLFVPRNAFPPTYIPQRRHFFSMGDIVREVITAAIEMRSLKNVQNTKKVINKDQILAVAYWSINENEKARECYEPDDSLFQDEEIFNTYTYFSSLLQKGKGELSVKEIKEIIKMYQIAIHLIAIRLPDPTTTDSFTKKTTDSLKMKLEECQTLLSNKKKL